MVNRAGTLWLRNGLLSDTMENKKKTVEVGFLTGFETPQLFCRAPDTMPWVLYIYRCGVKRLAMIFRRGHKALCVLRDRYR
jgi:hypothetical protein